MKGDPETPKCGFRYVPHIKNVQIHNELIMNGTYFFIFLFSNQLMHILKEIDIPFSTFDILSDEEVRQGLKKYSDWPTFPQVYVNGELIGGLDIIKDLKESGDLVSSLKGNWSNTNLPNFGTVTYDASDTNIFE